ncbi:hypothetical protein ACQB6R_09005 [Propionibacteriaceae bacterium G1746]|uniref:hypothetical protein n=1 Tax=Aestuariimicrobium sp. G57 TaxID=3418485 RepID=UPI003C15D93A
MTLVMARLAVLLNSIDAGLANAAEAEHAIRGHVHLVLDEHELLGVGQSPTLRIAMARLDRLSAHHPGWQLALVAPGRLGGLRGPAALSRTALAEVPEPEVGAAPVVVRHDGAVALVAGQAVPDEEQLDDELVTLRVLSAERPLSPPTPTEAARALAQAMAAATTTLATTGLTAGGRPDPAATVALGQAYGAANQSLLDQAMTVLAILAAAQQGETDLPHSHAITTRAAQLAPLRTAAWDALQAAVSWPMHLMQER